jgi:hypothetical protein
MEKRCVLKETKKNLNFTTIISTSFPQIDPNASQDEKDLIILEDEIEAHRLQLESALTQIEEQRSVYDETIANLVKDRTIKMQEEKVRRQHDQSRIEDYMKQVDKLRALCRENTRGKMDIGKERLKKSRLR